MAKAFRESTLDILFNSSNRVRLIKFFFYNQEKLSDAALISRRLQISPRIAKGELEKLYTIGLIKKRQGSFIINKDFSLYEELSALVAKASPALKARMAERIKNVGSIKLVLIAGKFLNEENSKADFLAVGDKINEKKLNKFFSDLEAETGCELNYVVLTSEEFDYRRRMYDRFIRDMLDYKHEKLINKLGI